MSYLLLVVLTTDRQATATGTLALGRYINGFTRLELSNAKKTEALNGQRPRVLGIFSYRWILERWLT